MDLSDGRPEASRWRTPRIDNLQPATLKIRHVAGGESGTAGPRDRGNLDVRRLCPQWWCRSVG